MMKAQGFSRISSLCAQLSHKLTQIDRLAGSLVPKVIPSYKYWPLRNCYNLKAPQFYWGLHWLWMSESFHQRATIHWFILCQHLELSTNYQLSSEQVCWRAIIKAYHPHIQAVKWCCGARLEFIKGSTTLKSHRSQECSWVSRTFQKVIPRSCSWYLQKSSLLTCIFRISSVAKPACGH